MDINTNTAGVNVTNTQVFYPGALNNGAGTGTALVSGTKYDVKLVHIPSNAMLLDVVVEVR